MNNINLKDALGTKDPKELAARAESFKDELNKSYEAGVTGRVRLTSHVDPASKAFEPSGDGRMLTKSVDGVAALESIVDSGDVTKVISPEVLESVRAQLEAARSATADITKDISTTSPLSTGLVPFDLEAPAKLLAPRPTPLRNRIPRKPGQGLARRFKRITGFSGTGTGGTSVINPAITESGTNSFGSLSLIRGPKVAYASDEKTINYKQFSVSDSVTFAANFAGQGFQDVRQLSQFAVLWSSMLSEERLLLGGRGTDSGFAGALAAPGALSAAARTAGSGETGNSANIAHLFIRAQAVGVWGESVSSAELDFTGLSAATGDVVDVTIPDVPGALGYRVYCGTTTGAANCFVSTNSDGSTRTGYNKFTINFTGAGTGGAPNAGTTAQAADTTAYAGHYDGIVTSLGDPNQSGYVKRINSAFSTSNPGAEFQTAFASLYDSVKSDPDEVLFNGNDRKQLSDLLKTASSANYRLVVSQDEASGATVGSVVTGLLNEVTGKMVDVTVHPWLPQGNCPIISWTLPIPDTEVSNVFEVHGPQDYMGIQWPVIQLTYDVSSYWFNALVNYAPAWGGMITGIKAA